MLHISGPWFPHANEGNTNALYCASMLVLLKPWRDLGVDLKASDESFTVAFDHFSASALTVTKQILSNIQYFHECSNKAKQHQEEDSLVNQTSYAGLDIGEHMDDFNESVEDCSVREEDVNISEDDILNASDDVFSTWELAYADITMNIAKEQGIFFRQGIFQCVIQTH
jgi:hypothetical protein